MWDPHATRRTATDYRKNDVLRSPNVIISPPSPSSSPFLLKQHCTRLQGYLFYISENFFAD
ncbi:hypothetical protein AXF42_Ash000808 [Apostasia shenzhenica]|uniref:Uncharacterized protein n=1 Tax=Apostasia shenzhenica TaxID=1088818 RepID=A0A2I0AT37_9ASPA|nr:hypothetical protein AXF42_Ash000808 [Apostasia shenzhenica]